MEKSRICRFLMNQVKSLMEGIEKEELWGFTRFERELTGLKYDLMLDDNKTYKSYHHDLWLYALCEDGIRVPITVSDMPEIRKFIPKNKYDFSDVYDFIRCNKKLIENYANEKTSYNIIYEIIKNLKASNVLTEDRSYIIPATLSPEETNLPVNIWVDQDKTYSRHAPRIKFRALKSSHNTREDPSMEINNPDRIHNLPKNRDISNNEINQIKDFVRKNKQSLLDLANKKIGLKDFKAKINKVGKETLNLKYINGFSVYKQGDKYNYLDLNGDVLLPYWVDKAQDFYYYGNGMLLAYIEKNGKGYYIDDKGKITNFNL